MENFELETNGKKLTLNESQREFVLRFREWRKNKDRLFFCLSGSAGTGKTTSVKYAIKDEYSIAVTAPTHKAKKVVQRATGIKAQTIQKLVGLRPDMNLEEFNHQNLLFSQTGNCLMQDFNLIVLDEASMLNQELVIFLKDKAKEFGTKILFMGDVNQLPPVKETIGLVFTDNEIEQFHLTIVERQQFGNPLLSLYGDILSDINSQSDKYEKISKMPGNLGYDFISDSKKYTELITSSFNHGEYSNNKILAWTNSKTRQWNNLVRRQVVSENQSPIVVGEYLMAYRTVQDLVNWRITITENSCDYMVKSVSTSMRDQRYFNTRTNKDDFLIIFGYEVLLENIDDHRCEMIFVVAKQSYSDFSMIDINKSEYAKKLKGQERGYAWKMYFDFRNRYFLLGDILDGNDKVLCAKDLDYYYAQTVHKSQGSTYSNVFVDEANLDTFWDKKMTQQEINSTRNRLKYVAFSRPTDAAFIYYKK